MFSHGIQPWELGDTGCQEHQSSVAWSQDDIVLKKSSCSQFLEHLCILPSRQCHKLAQEHLYSSPWEPGDIPAWEPDDILALEHHGISPRNQPSHKPSCRRCCILVRSWCHTHVGTLSCIVFFGTLWHCLSLTILQSWSGTSS